MELGVLFFVISDVKDYLVKEGRLQTNGKVDFTNLEDDLGLANVVADSLKAHGVDIPDQVSKVIAALPLIIGVFAK